MGFWDFKVWGSRGFGGLDKSLGVQHFRSARAQWHVSGSREVGFGCRVSGSFNRA